MSYDLMQDIDQSTGMNDRNKHEDKKDVYDFGVILLELVTGEPITSTTDVNMLKNQVDEYFFSLTFIIRQLKMAYYH